MRIPTGFRDALLCQFSALLLVVLSTGIVNGVMKPDRQLHRGRLLRQAPGGIELGEALGYVSEVVVMPVRLGIEGGQILINGEWVPFGGYLSPESNPPVWAGSFHVRDCRSRL